MSRRTVTTWLCTVKRTASLISLGLGGRTRGQAIRIAAGLWLAALFLWNAPVHARPPKLVLFITVDALGSDLLLRMRPRLHGGLAQILSEGAFFPNTYYQYAETVTAPGHATLATGANPWRHGIVGNTTFNTASGRWEAAFEDPDHPAHGISETWAGSSPDRLLAETVSDHLRLDSQSRSKSIAISVKARAAIALAGKSGQAWWFQTDAGEFTTGTYYAKELPGWVKVFNAKRIPEQYFTRQWTLFGPGEEYIGADDRPFESERYGLGRTFPHPLDGAQPTPGPQSHWALAVSPYMNDVLVQFAKAAMEAEQLGRHPTADLLSISFSSTDYTYHFFGPYSWESQDAMLRLDASLAELISAAQKAAGGSANLLVVLTADHGGMAIPEELASEGVTSIRVDQARLQQGLTAALQAQFGANLLAGLSVTRVYLEPKAIAARRVDPAAARRFAAHWLSQQAPVALAVARDDLSSGPPGAGYLSMLQKGHHPERGGDVLFILKPFHLLTEGKTGTSHGSPYGYDSQVPFALLGKGVKPGLYLQKIHTVDIAPTVAALLEMGAPAMAEGTPRAEAIAPAQPPRIR